MLYAGHRPPQNLVLTRIRLPAYDVYGVSGPFNFSGVAIHSPHRDLPERQRFRAPKRSVNPVYKEKATRLTLNHPIPVRKGKRF